MRILWIEDDPNRDDHNYFKSNIFSKHTISPVEDEDDFLFDKAYELIDNNLAQYDYIVIDINLTESLLKPDGKGEELKIKFNLEESDFLKEAGFHLYIQLMEKGFPKEHIIFFSANIGSISGEQEELIDKAITLLKKGDKEAAAEIIDEFSRPLSGPQTESLFEAINAEKTLEYLENYRSKLKSKIADSQKNSNIQKESGIPDYKELKSRFFSARIELPNQAISKTNRDKLEEWFDRRLNFSPADNDSTKSFLILRRGILNVVDELVKKETTITPNFKNEEGQPLINAKAFIEGLRWLLQVPKLNYGKEGMFYFVLCDYLTKPFEIFTLRKLKKFDSDHPLKKENKPMWEKIMTEERSSLVPPYFLRNWIAHGLISESDGTPDITPPDAAFVFLLVLKSLFNVENYGHFGELKSLFGDLNIPLQKIKNKVVNLHKGTYSTPYISDTLDVIDDIGKQKGKRKPDHKFYWKQQNFLSHFFASYLFASSNLKANKAFQNNDSQEGQYSLEFKYILQETPFLKIAFKRMEDFEG